MYIGLLKTMGFLTVRFCFLHIDIINIKYFILVLT